MFLSCKHSANLREIAQILTDRGRPAVKALDIEDENIMFQKIGETRYLRIIEIILRHEYSFTRHRGRHWHNWLLIYSSNRVQKWKTLDLNRIFEEKWSSWANHSECCKGTVVTSLLWYIVFFSPEPAQQCQLVLSSFGLFTLLVFSGSFSFQFYFIFIVIFFPILCSVIFFLISFTFHFHFFHFPYLNTFSFFALSFHFTLPFFSFGSQFFSL